MNVNKPLMTINVAPSISILVEGCSNYRKFLGECTGRNRKKIAEYVDHSLVTGLAPVIGYDEASKIGHDANEPDLTLKEAAPQRRFFDEQNFERLVDPAKVVKPYVAAQTLSAQAQATELVRDGQA